MFGSRPPKAVIHALMMGAGVPMATPRTRVYKPAPNDPRLLQVCTYKDTKAVYFRTEVSIPFAQVPLTFTQVEDLIKQLQEVLASRGNQKTGEYTAGDDLA